eukprot:gene6133-9411_t
MHALFVLGDLRAKLVKQFQSRFVYVTEQTPEGIYIAEIDTEAALVVDDKPRLELKVGDHFRAAVLPSREGGKFELKFRDIKLTVYGLGDYAFVSSAEGQGIVFKEGHSVMLVFAANEQLVEGLTKTLKAVTGKAAKWRKGELFHEQHLLDAQATAAQLFARKAELQGAWLSWVAGQLYELKPAEFASMVRRELQRLNNPA